MGNKQNPFTRRVIQAGKVVGCFPVPFRARASLLAR